MSKTERSRIAKLGGIAKHKVRGLAGADEKTRKRVASKGGKLKWRNKK